MLGRLSNIRTPRRRRRALDEVRRQIADCGYALDDLTDSQLEQAVTGGRGGIEKVLPLTPRTIYWTLRRLSPDAEDFGRRKIKEPPRSSRYF